MNQLGATAEQWAHFDFVLGLGANLLPCVPASPDVKVAEGSQLAGKVGKIPSMFNGQGEAHGLTGWQKRVIDPAELAYWSSDRRLNMCVRTGPISNIYALDIDIDDQKTIAAIDRALTTWGWFPARTRPNSYKKLYMFRMAESCKKRKIKLDEHPRGPAIELLADGQQFVACGTHASGKPYQWLPELPMEIPTLTLAQVDSIWQMLTVSHAKAIPVEAAPALVPLATEPQTTEEVLRTISEDDWQRLLQCLRFLLDKVQDNDTWSELGYGLLSLQGSRPAEQLWLDFSRKAVGHEPGAAEAWWSAHRGQEPRTDFRHIFNMARGAGMLRVADVTSFKPVPEEPNSDLVDVMPPEVGAGPPIVRISGANFSATISRLEAIITPHIYTQGAHLVRTSEAHTDEGIQRSSDGVMLLRATLGWARSKFGAICEFQKFDARQGEWVTVAPNTELIGTLLDQGGWTVLRPLDAIARAPFLRKDGSICDVPGYDPLSRTLYVPSIDFPPIPVNPTWDDARAALLRLREPFNEFPWKEEASESAFVSHILAEAARLAMERCPMYFYDAPMAGTGKSTLQEMAARIVHGTEPAMRPWVPDEDELRKSLYACLMSGDRSIWFDNVPDGHKVRSSVLEAFLTSAVWKDRKLGESATTAIPNKAVLVASGNNLTPVSALARRSIVVRLDANTEHLRERVFRIPNPRKYVSERRAQMLVDALTIIRAFLMTADDRGVTFPVALPSFEEWSNLARDPLLWLGMADPVITQLNETDDEMQNISPIFEKLAANFGTNKFTAVDMARVVGSLSDERNELSDSLMQMGCAEPNNPVKLGYWLRAAKDKVGGGWKLVNDGHATRGVKWRLRQISGGLT